VASEDFSPADWITRADSAFRYQRQSLALRAENRMAWLAQHVLPELKTSLPLAVGIGFATSLSTVEGNVWQTWMTSRTSLMPDALPQAKPEVWPFPDAILPLLPRQSGFTPARRALVILLLMSAAAGIAALYLSATANHTVLRQVADDIQKYHAISMADFDPKARQLTVLKRDAETLDSWYREGEPLRLGFGLYPGERIRQPVLRAIRGYRPPEQKNALAASGPIQTIRLDSMALFDVGLARLKDGSTSVLVDALVNIRAKPGWLILVAGHTDATGDEKSNQHLSLRRAEAVRDWMLNTSDIPATCFAVQGMGENQPAATNDTPEGRATNRRVEISLVPRTDACQDVEPKMPPDAAVSQRNQQGE
jgi:outer membrane protein OmpA-like peptidoglycan-associated protein